MAGGREAIRRELMNTPARDPLGRPKATSELRAVVVDGVERSTIAAGMGEATSGMFVFVDRWAGDFAALNPGRWIVSIRSTLLPP
jgi:hypothetical protein